MTKKLSLELRQTRKPIQTACGFCHEKHLQCDVGRPCQNCRKRNIASFCRDKVKRRRKRKRSDASNFDKDEAATQTLNFNTVNPGEGSSSAMTQDEKNTGTTTATTTRTTTNFRSESKASSSTENISRAMKDPADTIIANSLLDKPTIGDTDDTGWGFGSIWTNDEYMTLNDLTSFASESMPNQLGPIEEQRSPRRTLGEPLARRYDSSQPFQYLNFGSKLHKTDSRPYISLEQPGNVPSIPAFTMNKGSNDEDASPQQKESQQMQLWQQQASQLQQQASQLQQQASQLQQQRTQQNEPVSEWTPFQLRLLIKTPKDLFDKKNLVKPHNYRKAYKDLLECLHKMFLGSYYRRQNGRWRPVSDDEDQMRRRLMRKEQLQHIAKSIGELYMPKFVALTSNMIEEDLLLQELVLQRSLLELENMSKLVNCTPICIWRRSGEICFVSNEFCSLTGFYKREILDQRRFIVEFMDHQSVVSYYDLFHEHLAFGPKDSTRTILNKDQAVYTECNLLLNNGSYLKCACCLTARRDAFNISLLLMGQFLPIFDVQ
ncbi:ZYRO0F01804p [Zygosaccharomyces rouxii]|uniref:Glucose starvation modulator protein 1 n=1 Tax=Zygosaccharomyces rouxii (strain ATCC 2623 / CBS 732 / NBRC 1130 / NCYC 568 / NRRL Y-229) TaxID=559307 RepID=GSM1_ZYGRC|nr:uncharacterized protein ZYRO0F01804g [Zygosaccharomyces rouxii]C5DX31.1 RecName: Full=Glucose starvation modulator protein 1 [Zygosaccharomyces rouxii CBS 732]KAH9199107.1 glucose starvation modulator protein 1 [Zygosaccharomyces rouxii]CAR28342.1 ZYRO0F01804p [Zygosaccharomyces rouxii]